MAIENYLETLELEGESVTRGDIRSAYKKLALKYHPDKNPNDPTAKSRFEKVKDAYDILIALPEFQTDDQSYRREEIDCELDLVVSVEVNSSYRSSQSSTSSALVLRRDVSLDSLLLQLSTAFDYNYNSLVLSFCEKNNELVLLLLKSKIVKRLSSDTINRLSHCVNSEVTDFLLKNEKHRKCLKPLSLFFIARDSFRFALVILKSSDMSSQLNAVQLRELVEKHGALLLNVINSDVALKRVYNSLNNPVSTGFAGGSPISTVEKIKNKMKAGNLGSVANF